MDVDDRRAERGHLMIALVVALAMLLIFSTVATRSWLDVIRRDREADMMFRAQEISRALLKYRKANQRLPNTLEELMEPGPQGQYFLRRLYEDPLIPDGQWGLIYSAPGGGIVDPNSPSVEVSGGLRIGDSSTRVNSAAEGLTPGLQGRQATGLPIAGVKSLSQDRPFRVHKGQQDYAMWLFTILDLEGQAAVSPELSLPDN
jgi:type II secretory pathway pseudopilin PulG